MGVLFASNSRYITGITPKQFSAALTNTLPSRSRSPKTGVFPAPALAAHPPCPEAGLVVLELPAIRGYLLKGFRECFFRDCVAIIVHHNSIDLPNTIKKLRAWGTFRHEVVH